MLNLLTIAVAPVLVERNRRSPVDANEAPFIILFDGGHTADPSEAGDTAYEMQIGIDATIGGSGVGDADLGPAINALYATVLRALMVDPSLGGLCIDLRERGLDVRIIPTEASSAPLAEFSLDIVASFRTADGNPYAF